MGETSKNQQTEKELTPGTKNGILFILNAVGKSEKSIPNEKEK